MNTAPRELSSLDAAGLSLVLASCPDTSLIRALGLPTPDPLQPALTALHAGAAYHRLAVISETVFAYRRGAALAPGDLAYLRLLEEPLRGEPARDTASCFYRAACALDDRLAEAWFGQARLDQHRCEYEAALAGFVRAAALKPHVRAPAHAYLHANAHFHAACILEDLGQNAAALKEYRAALRLLDNFGVHHRRIAYFLRRQGMIEESIPEFEKLMAYGHRYFTEFTLPPLKVDPPPAPPAEVLEVLYETSDGAAVVFWAGAYYRLARSQTPATAARLGRLEAASGGAGRLPGKGWRALLYRLSGGPSAPPAIRKADNIAELEPGC